MIRVEVQPYCQNCRVFEADVEKPEVAYSTTYDPAQMRFIEQSRQTDTVVRCVRRKQCENIKRYLEQQQEKEKGGQPV